MKNNISYAVVDPNWGEPFVRLETIRSTKHETEDGIETLWEPKDFNWID